MGKIYRNFTLDSGDDNKHRMMCRECNKETLHSIVSTFRERGSEDCGHGNSVDWSCDNQIVQCLGCEEVSFRTVSTFSEDYDYHDGGMYYPETIKYYPARAAGLGRIESHSLPRKIQQIYQETILSLENEQYVLAGIGIRALVETICKDLQAPGNNLYEKINSLRDQSIVTTEGANTLHKLRVLGNDAAHEVKAHNSAQLGLAMNIIEHMLDGTYIIPNRVQRVFPENDG